jgi:hypothetical protein
MELWTKRSNAHVKTWRDRSPENSVCQSLCKEVGTSKKLWLVVTSLLLLLLFFIVKEISLLWLLMTTSLPSRGEMLRQKLLALHHRVFAYQGQEGYTYRHTDWWEGFMKYAVEMGSGAMIYIPSFIKIGLAIQKLTRGELRKHTHKQTRRQHVSHISLLLFCQNKESRLRMDSKQWVGRTRVVDRVTVRNK